MLYRLGFALSADGSLMVLTETLPGVPDGAERFAATVFPDENDFLAAFVMAEFPRETTILVVAEILRTVAGRNDRPDWVEVQSSARRLRALGLHLPGAATRKETSLPDGTELREVLLRSPTPMAMVRSPQHEIVLINPAYVQLLGRRSAASLLGKPVRQALPEFAGQPFFGLLDQVYRTGETFVGREIPGKLAREESGEVDQAYFDIIYHPVRDAHGDVCGVLAHANDVTERVLARQVSEAREAQLYRQWAELESIYRKSAVGMKLVDAQDFRILRINEEGATLLGSTAEALLGQNYFQVFPVTEGLREAYARVIAGEVIRNLPLELRLENRALLKRFLVSLSPVLGEAGQVEAIASVTVDVTNEGCERTVVVRV